MGAVCCNPFPLVLEEPDRLLCIGRTFCDEPCEAGRHEFVICAWYLREYCQELLVLNPGDPAPSKSAPQRLVVRLDANRIVTALDYY
jgi:hypothetical protein